MKIFSRLQQKQQIKLLQSLCLHGRCSKKRLQKSIRSAEENLRRSRWPSGFIFSSFVQLLLLRKEPSCSHPVWFYFLFQKTTVTDRRSGVTNQSHPTSQNTAGRSAGTLGCFLQEKQSGSASVPEPLIFYTVQQTRPHSQNSEQMFKSEP